MAESAHTKACPYCGERILAVAHKCKHCRSVLPRRQLRVAEVPWYRRVPAVLALVVLFAPAAALVLLTGPVYRVRDGRAVPWRGWRPALANFVAFSICILAGITAFEALHRPGCRSGEVAQLLGELTQRQVTEAQGLLAAALPAGQGPLKVSVRITGARDAAGGKALQCVATAHLQIGFPKLAEPVEGTAEVRYAVDPAGWARVYVHVADAEWIGTAFGQARERYAQRSGGAR
jgi:hypothetical protein